MKRIFSLLLGLLFALLAAANPQQPVLVTPGAPIDFSAAGRIGDYDAARLPWENAQAPPDLLALSTTIRTSPNWVFFNPAMSFQASLQTTLVPEHSQGSGTPTFTRATTAYQTDFEGKQNLVPSGATREQGARLIWNRINLSISASPSTWSGTAGVTTGVADPLGGTTAYTITATGSKERYLDSVAGNFISLAAGATLRNSIYIRRRTGTGGILFYNGGEASAYTTITASVTTGWQRIAAAVGTAVTTGANNNRIGIFLNTAGDAVDIWRPMSENVVGQTNQAPSEWTDWTADYGVSSGATVKGMAYSDRLNGNTVASNVITEATGAAINSSTSKFGVLPGVAGSNFTTPAATANKITGDIDIRVYISSPDWTPAAEVDLVSRFDSANNRSYELRIESGSTGKLALGWTPSNDAAIITSTATTSTGFTDGTAHWVRATLDVDNGAGGNDVNFYTSEDGVTWTKLGNTVTTAGTTSIAQGTSLLYLFARTGSDANVGLIYRAQIYNGINGTLAVDFNPNLSTSAQTFTAATGEVWTSNGNARIYGNTHATYGIQSYWDASGPVGLLTEAANTNSILQSNTLGTTWTISNAADMNAVAADAYVSVDGTTTMDKLQPKATTAVHSLDQAFTFTAAKYTTAVDLRYVPATPQRWVALILNDGTTTWGASFDLLNGVVGAVSAGATSGIEATGLANVYRVWVTNTANAAAAAGTVKISLNATDTATLESAARAGTETLGAGMVQHEIGMFKSSRITTTTVAVTRPADVEQYVSAGNLSATAMTIAQDLTPSTALGSATVYHLATYVDANNWTAQWSDGTNLNCSKRISGTTHTASIAWTRTVGTTVKTLCRFDAAGSQVALGGVLGTADATGTAAQIGAAFQVGADGNGAGQDYMEHRNVRVWLGSVSDTQATTQTSWNTEDMMPYRVAWAEAANDDEYLIRANSR